MTAGGRIVLHVGAPKTGSTYIQTRLRANAAELRARGVYVPVLPAVSAMAGNAKLLATVLHGEATPSFRRAFPDLDLAELTPGQVLNDLLRDWRQDEEDVVLSAENFRPSHAGRLKAWLPERASVTVVLFVRRQDLWIESYFNQLVKTRDIACDLDQFVRTLGDTLGERLCRPDWLAHYQAWRGHFDQTRLSVYDAVKDKLFEAFLVEAGLDRAAGLPDVPRVQLAMNTFQLAYLTTLPRDLPFPVFLDHRAACEEVSRCDDVSVRASLFGAAALAEIGRRYRPSNTRLLNLLERPDLEPVLQPQTPAASTAPLEDLRRTDAFRRFQGDVESRLATSRRAPLAEVGA